MVSGVGGSLVETSTKLPPSTPPSPPGVEVCNGYNGESLLL